MTQIERRQFWTAVHRYGGLAAMGFLLIASATGVLLSFANEIDAALNRDLLHRDAAAPIDAPRAATALQAAHPEWIITALPAKGAAYRTLPVGVAAVPGRPALGFDQVFVDDDAGHVRGVRDTGAGWDRRHLMQGVFQFHYTLLAGTAGRWLMGVAALLWLIGNLVGVYLTLPLRGAFWKQWKRTWRFSVASPLPRLLLDLHRSSALWLLVGVTLLAFTSVCMNFFEEAFVPTVTVLSPARPSLLDRPSRAPVASIPHVTAADALRLAAAQGARRHVGWQVAKAGYDPEHGVYRVLFTDDGVENYHRLGPVSLYLDARDGRVVEVDDPYTDSTGQKVSRALYPLHTGKVAGRVGIAVDVLLGLATIEMIGTGAYLWLKRRRPRVAARRARRARALAAQR